MLYNLSFFFSILLFRYISPRIFEMQKGVATTVTATFESPIPKKKM